ncbi:MAG: hypothetical protein FJX34_00840 [Alphaproteobacteria bacterium]|nr:hypothetical protein [Alphaproteobacteria bacterium]
MVKDEDLESFGLIPFTVNAATISDIKDLRKISLSDKLRSQSGDVSDNLGSRFLSFSVDVEEFRKMADASILPHQKVSPTTSQVSGTAVSRGCAHVVASPV